MQNILLIVAGRYITTTSKWLKLSWQDLAILLYFFLYSIKNSISHFFSGFYFHQSCSYICFSAVWLITRLIDGNNIYVTMQFYVSFFLRTKKIYLIYKLRSGKVLEDLFHRDKYVLQMNIRFKIKI